MELRKAASAAPASQALGEGRHAAALGLVARLKQRPYTALLAVTAVAAGALLAGQRPFAFYSPDVSFHAAKLLRATHGELFRDPVSGTPSIYPAAFHAFFGTMNRFLDLDTLHLAVLIEVVDFLGLLGAAFCLARAVVRDLDRAALCTLCLSLLFYSPTGRHILVVNPANFALVLQVAGFAAVASAMRTGRRGMLAAGALLCGMAVNVVWYDAISAVAVLGAVAVEKATRRPHDVRGAAPLLAFAIPFVFTVVHLIIVRDVLADSVGLVSPAVDVSVVREWAAAILTRGNSRFAAALERSAWARAHYLLVLAPFGVLVAVTAVAGLLRPPRDVAGDERRRLRVLGAAGLLVFALSFSLSTTRDVPRVVRAEFPGWALLLVVAFRVASASAALRWGGPGLATLAVGTIGYTVWHSGFGATSAPSPATQAVIRFIERLPDHAETRIFVTESNLRRLLPFVEFRSFVNHAHGRYYSQDLASAAQMYEAYRDIRDRSGQWQADLARYDVRYLAFRHAEGGAEREAARRYLDGSAVVKANPEWWVVKAPRPAVE